MSFRLNSFEPSWIFYLNTKSWAISKTADFEINTSNGAGHERCHKGNGPDEQADELTIIAENYARI